MKTLFYHSQFKDHKIPRVTFCATVEENHNPENLMLSIGVSRCSKKDQFSRKKGRVIAEGRARRNPILQMTVLKGTELSNFFQTCREEEEHLILDARLI